MRSPENRFEFERSSEQEPDLEFCLRTLTGEVIGKKIDTMTDRYLIQQINASHIQDTPQGSLLRCQVKGCAAECVLAKKKSGVLKLVSQSGTGICEQK